MLHDLDAFPGDTAPGRGPAREALRGTIEALAAANLDLAEAQAAAGRLEAILEELATAEKHLTTCRSEDDRTLGAWFAGGARGERPQPSAQTLTAERALAAFGRDAIAARAALPKHRTKVQRRIEHVRNLGAARRDAAYRVAVEAARELIYTGLQPALRYALAIEAKVRSVEQALSEFANGPDPSTVAMGCSVDIASAIREAKAAVAVPHDRATGKRLVERLMSDPEARLGDDAVSERAVISEPAAAVSKPAGRTGIAEGAI